MNLVIKNINETADVSEKKVYKDARINDGTLFFIEFSNRGALKQFDLSKGITDLADDVDARGEDIVTDPTIGLGSTATMPVLTEDKGMPMSYVGNQQLVYTTGIMIRGVGSYLFNKQPKAVFIVWLRMDMTLDNIAESRILRLAQDGGTVPYAVTVNNAGSSYPNVSVSLAGKSGFNNQGIGINQSTQLAVEYVGENSPNRLYINGVFVGLASGDGLGKFEAPIGDDVLAIGGSMPNPDVTGAAVLFEAALHDLDEPGLTGEEVVKKDYDYVNEIGEFLGKTGVKRPYANLV